METSGETAGGLCDFLQSGELGAGPQARWLATPASADRLAVSGNGRNDLDCRQDDAVHPTPPDGTAFRRWPSTSIQKAKRTLASSSQTVSAPQVSVDKALAE